MDRLTSSIVVIVLVVQALLPPYLEGDEAHASNLVVTPTGAWLFYSIIISHARVVI